MGKFLEKDMFRYALMGVLMLSSAAAVADGPSYSYIQATYQEVELDASGTGFSDPDGDGFGVAGSVEVGDKWHIFADYATADLEGVVDIDLTTAGLGYRHGISNKTDVFAELGFAKADFEGIGDDTGISVRLGIRSMVSDSLEISANIGESDYDDVDFGTEFGANLWYTVSGNVAVGAEVRFADDITRYGVGVRLFFDQ
ncbi:MAG: porin [Woeseiaceae bacterium]